MKLEIRSIPRVEIRAEPDTRGFEAVVLRYNVVDDFRTRFRPGAFTESLEARLPRIVWAHDWTEPLGRYVDYRDTEEALTLIGEFDDFDAVPRARQAHAQLRSGTIDQFSIGFVREQDEPAKSDDPELRGVVDITKGTLDEASPILVGAVPGTELVSVRSRPDVEQAAAVLHDLARKVDLDEFTRQIGTILEPEPAVPYAATDSDDDGEAPEDAAEVAVDALDPERQAELDAEIEEAVAKVRARR